MTLEFGILFLRKALCEQDFKIFKEWLDDKPQVHWFEPGKVILIKLFLAMTQETIL